MVINNKKNSEVDHKTVELIFSEIKDRLKTQKESVAQLENKSSRIIGFVGLVIGLGITLIQLSIKDELFKSLTNQQILIEFIFYAAGIVILLFSITFAFWAFRVESYRADPDPLKLVEKYLYFPHEKLLNQLNENFLECFAHNQKILLRKSKYVRLSLLFFLIGLCAYFFSMITFLIFNFNT